VASVTCQMVEFHRYAGKDVLRREGKYIRTSGWDSAAQELSPNLDHEDLLRDLNALRYGIGSTQDVSEARARLATEATHFLDGIAPAHDHLAQLDLVTNAGELWAFPFEACFERYPAWLQDEQSGVVLTRRIRSDFAETPGTWPAVPRVLFVHAPVTRDLEQSLVDAHVQALRDALHDWFSGKDEQDRDLLHVREVTSAHELTHARDELAPTYVHLLAHGAATRGDPLLPDRTIWGLRLGYEGEHGVPPADVAEALRREKDRPLVVTLAACDSANQMGAVFAVQSVAQELHRCGVPVVVGSQLPLTKTGSLVLVRAFYERLLRGADVRAALHAARVRLRADAEAHHDWLSLVGYVRLPPETYAEHLAEVGLRMELRLLDAAQKRADRLSEHGGTLDEFAAVEQRVQTRLGSLQAGQARLSHRRDLLEECHGLEASAYKRLAELRFVRGLRHATTREKDWADSWQALTESLARYRTAYEADLHSHWLGGQQVALEAALTGRVSSPDDWLFTQRAARIARDRSPGRDYWACGTLAELTLLGPCAGAPRDIPAAQATLALFRKRAEDAGDAFAVEATRRQFRRYVHWWTNEHGYFPGRGDLSNDALELLPLLE
jgi:hypothetical protein